jgi:asparagine synthase (glutamine-hydrolysing)
MKAAAPPLDPLEIHSGMIIGSRHSTGPAPEWPPASGVRQALEEILLPALSRPPCKVAFSGGRDSSALLASATEIARRHGLDDPVPLTFRFDDNPRSVETEWQELMVRHLDLREWETVGIQAEFDVLGPLARDTLLRHGLFWPPNAFTMRRMFEAAGAGSLVTGTGGDEAFGGIVKPKIMTTRQVLRLHRLPMAVMILVVDALPFGWKLRAQNYKSLRLPWLTRSARREVRRRYVRNAVVRRDSGRSPLEILDDSRYLELLRGIVSTLTRDAGIELVEPFLDPRFFRALLSEAPEAGVPNRNAGLVRFFGDLLPAAILERRSKARFTESFWGPDSREFARTWDGSGLDSSLAEPDAMREHWLRPRPDMRSATAMQAAWLSGALRGHDSNHFHTQNEVPALEAGARFPVDSGQ